jgi:hypothetical protein
MRYLLFILLVSIISVIACNQPTKQHNVNQQKAVVEDSIRQDSSNKHEPTFAEKLIIPGKSVGQTTLNEDAENVIKRLGKPDTGDAAMGKALSIWYANHDTTGYETMIFSARQMGTANETSQVKQIRITSPWFTTQEGLHVGSTLKQINEHYVTRKAATFSKEGKPYFIYKTDKGIAFEIGSNNSCTGIIVFDPKAATGQAYLPFYSNLKVLN